MRQPSTVSIARNATYDLSKVAESVETLLANLNVHREVGRGMSVLIKVNMSCSGARAPADRHTTHPTVVEALIRAFQDCGATVAFGDDVARAGRFCERIWTTTGFREVANKTGAQLVDFVVPGAREVKSSILVPTSYLISNAYYQYDFIVNAANCRSHTGVVMSGAVKNMFGFVVGARKWGIHKRFPLNSNGFSRTIANINAAIPANLSILDLTSVFEGDGATNKIVDVGYMLAGKNPASLDAVASWLIGYNVRDVMTTIYGERYGLGTSKIEDIRFIGMPFDSIKPKKLSYPAALPNQSKRERLASIVREGLLEQRPVIDAKLCECCGKCRERCPASCIGRTNDSGFTINPEGCSRCLCCVRVCESGAVKLGWSPLATKLRRLCGKPFEPRAVSMISRDDFSCNPTLVLAPPIDPARQEA